MATPALVVYRTPLEELEPETLHPITMAITRESGIRLVDHLKASERR